MKQSNAALSLCVLQSSYELSTDPDKDSDPPASVAPWLPNCKITDVHLHKATSVMAIQKLVANHKFDLYVNLCEAPFDDDRAGIEVIQILEKLNLPFTGVISSCFEPTKHMMKVLAQQIGIVTAPYVIAFYEEEIEDAAELNFPVIVKHHCGYASIGMTKNCKCYNMEQVRVEAKRLMSLFSGVLIEEFVDGDEFTVLVAENAEDFWNPVVYSPVQCTFPPGETWKHHDLKWKEFVGIAWHLVTDSVLIEKLSRMAKDSFIAILKGKGYGRIDVRMRKEDGELFFLEINPMPGLFYPPECPGSADMILNLDPRGHAGFLDNLFAAALKTHRESEVARTTMIMKPMPRLGGYGVFAGRDINEGEIVRKGENQPYYLTSAAHASSPSSIWNSSDHQKAMFRKSAYPLTDTLYVTWGEFPDQWSRFNHSCNPNCWIQGLDVVARRKISKKEQLTLDHTTFKGEDVELDCTCGHEQCKRAPKLKERVQTLQKYGNHISPYIEEKKLLMLQNGHTHAPQPQRDTLL